MDCHYYDAGVCRSCTRMGMPYADQLRDKQSAAAAVLAAHVAPAAWRDPFAGTESGFRNKAKLVTGGAPGEVTVGILDARGRGVDLRDCGLYEAPLQAAMTPVVRIVEDLRLLPYDVPKRRGELKHLLLTTSPAGELMVRFVLRSTGQLARIRDALPRLLSEVPGTRVVSANIQPEHKAVIEGADEIVLTDDDTLPMDLDGIRLHLRPNSFFQTNTSVTKGLYRQAREWISDLDPTVVWDLYCGVGGFALNAAGPGRRVFGSEVSAEAIASARISAAERGGEVHFEAGDSARVLAESGWPAPDLVIVNPPRRGLDADLAAQIENGPAAYLLYSSCNPQTLARDLDRMPSFQVRAARLFDMFPQTTHAEVLILAGRLPTTGQPRAATAAS